MTHFSSVFIRVHPWLALLLLFGCSYPRPVVEVPTRSGEVLRMQEVRKTGSRKDVPAGKKPRNVVAQARFDHRGGAGLISITQGPWPWSDVMVGTNCTQCHASEPIPFVQPKRPWWYWPAWFLAFVAMGALIIFGSYVRAFFAPLCGFLKRVLKRS